MSPEQARGLALDKRTEIWAFGCVLFEMLAGRMAFPGKTISDTIAAILEREPEWAALPAQTRRPQVQAAGCCRAGPQVVRDELGCGRRERLADHRRPELETAVNAPIPQKTRNDETLSGQLPRRFGTSERISSERPKKFWFWKIRTSAPNTRMDEICSLIPRGSVG